MNSRGRQIRGVEYPAPYANEPRTEVADSDTPLSNGFLANAINKLLSALGDLSDMIIDQNHSFDEYQPNGVLDPDSGITVLTVQPEYEYGALCTSVLVTGPPSTAFTLQIGKRAFTTLLTDATGKFELGPVLFSLTRNDIRQLTSATPGAWTLELMGYAQVAKFSVGGYLFR